MRALLLPALIVSWLTPGAFWLRGAETSSVVAEVEAYRPQAERLLGFADTNRFGYQRLGYLCDTFGPRVTGSDNLEKAIDWILETLKQDGFSDVHGEPATVPHWVRGDASLRLLTPRPCALHVLAVGGSIATPPEGIRAEVLVVDRLDALKKPGVSARGKIVLFNVPFTDYGATVAIRTRGAIEASRSGAVASLIRSVGPFSMQTPHTGMMQYDAAVAKIPHAAITLEDAEMLQRMQDRGQSIQVELKMNCQSLPQATSRNVVADLKGTTHPEEIVVLSGHIDSWDVGQGAMDDGGGCIAAWEAARWIRTALPRPQRTIRIVLWTGEESGTWGAKAYRKQHENELSSHVIGIESDEGVFAPEGFAFTGSEVGAAIVRSIGRSLEPIHANSIKLGCGGMDVLELLQQGVPAMDLRVQSSKYFWFHHTEADTVDKLQPKEINQCAAAMAVYAYILADMPTRLPR